MYIADEGGVTKMSGGISWVTLPAGYLGSTFIGACLIACGFNTDASKVASIVLAVFFLFTLWWAKKNWLYVCSLPLHCWLLESWVQRLMLLSLRSWILIIGMSGLIVLFWFVAGGAALRYLVSIVLLTYLSIFLLFSSGTLYWGHVMFVLRMGCDRLVGMGWISVQEPILNPWF